MSIQQQSVLDKANNAKIPVFGSEIEQVKAGCVASMGIDYYQLGIETGKLDPLMDAGSYLEKCTALAPEELPYIVSHFGEKPAIRN